MQICQLLLTSHAGRLPGESACRPLYRALIVCLTRSRYELRTAAGAAVKKILAQANATACTDRAVLLLAELTQLMASVRIIVPGPGDDEAPAADSGDEVALLHCLRSITGVPRRDNKNWERLCSSAFKAAHHPALQAEHGNFWAKLVTTG